MKLLVVLLITIGIAFCNGQNDTTMHIITTEEPVTTQQPVTTQEPVTTQQPITTQEPKTTTSTKSPDVLANITVPKNSPNFTCLKLQFDLDFNIKYQAEKENLTTVIKLPADYDYDGSCNDTKDTVSIMFYDKWSLMFEYTLVDSKHQLSTIELKYVVTAELFPNASAEIIGKEFTANVTDLKLFQGNIHNSYKCMAKTTVDINSDVKMEITNYLGQPFYNKKNGDFDTALDCPADISGTSKLVPIIVGSALAFLVILVLIAYLIGRKRHRSGYQSV